MRSCSSTARLFGVILALVVLFRPAAGRADTRIGVAEVEITPPRGFPIAGYYYERLATGTHDPLKAKALVFAGDAAQAALVVCDLTGIATDLTVRVRDRAEKKTGIPGRNIVVAATHSHTAPDYGKDLYEALAGPGDPHKPRYSETLIDAVVEAIARAKQAAEPAILSGGSAAQSVPISFNRRFVMRDGSVRTWMDLKNPEVVRPAGPIDPEIGLLLVRSAKTEKPLGILSNFALHLDTVGGLQWSADYPYYIEQQLRHSLGAGVVSIFGNGCCGDINHVDPGRRERNRTDFIGRSLAATIEPAVARLRRIERPELQVHSATVRLPLLEISAGEVKRA